MLPEEGHGEPSAAWLVEPSAARREEPSAAAPGEDQAALPEAPHAVTREGVSAASLDVVTMATGGSTAPNATAWRVVGGRETASVWRLITKRSGMGQMLCGIPDGIDVIEQASI